jgi:hypothetical protein
MQLLNWFTIMSDDKKTKRMISERIELWDNAIKLHIERYKLLKSESMEY